MAEYNYLSDGRPDGTMLGNAASDKVGFYGTTPAVQATTVAALGTVVFSAAFTGMWAFSSSTVATATIARIDSIIAALKTVGIMASS